MANIHLLRLNAITAVVYTAIYLIQKNNANSSSYFNVCIEGKIIPDTCDLSPNLQ